MVYSSQIANLSLARYVETQEKHHQWNPERIRTDARDTKRRTAESTATFDNTLHREARKLLYFYLFQKY